MPQVQYPCPECKHPVTIEYRQAGQIVKCVACQGSFDAPKLRELKALAPADNLSSGARENRTGSNLRNWMFVIGMALLVIGLTAGWLSRQYASTMVVSENAAASFRQSTAQELDTFSPAQLWQTWDSISDNKVLPDWEVAVPRKVEKVGQGLLAFSLGLYVAAACGLLLIIGSFLLGAVKPKSSR